VNDDRAGSFDANPPIVTGLEPEVRMRMLARLRQLYGYEHADSILEQIQLLAVEHVKRRPKSRRSSLWDQRDAILITYGDSIQSPGEPPLQTLDALLRNRLQGLFSTVHVLPFFPYCSDDGFAVIDYRMVNPELGGWPDVIRLAERFDLMMDLVLNHVSRESLWFADYRGNLYPGRDYFLEIDPSENLSMVVRPRTSPLLSEVYTRRGRRFVWSTFGPTQIDLNYRNPHVLLEFIDILLFYLRQGARIVRLDAVAYLWKSIGTPCIHLPETHQVIKLLRDLLSDIEPCCMLLTETNVPHQENISYFGDGDEAHAIYQFSLPPLLLHGVHFQTTRHLRHWAEALQAPPTGCTFVNFTASHDGVGLRPLEGLIAAEELEALLEAMHQRGGYVSRKRNMDGSDSPYELNISYFDALGDPSLGTDALHIARFMLSQAVPLCLQGIPAVYVNSLSATRNDLPGVERTGRTRSINRRRWDRGELEYLLDDRNTEAGQVFALYKRWLLIRREQAAFHPDAEQRVLDLADGLLGIERQAADRSQTIWAVHNFTAAPVDVPLAVTGAEGQTRRWDLLSGAELPQGSDTLTLPPYGVAWVSGVGSGESVASASR
jgi:sucrose phosphorylase